ncbi:MAG: aspartate aminotransferase family protein [Acidibacillus sp.]|uniref:Acetylornithine aminotransferase n=1 Tax=Sulfoacidibacillus ferrooxidans TaxID=2005001 RepID=A0A9X1V863_9BACL|nr:aspartate aminotransferase family protein [Sulfoacidibacillus ferrooxidans]MCI0182719.1 Acetylornithine aminotransferase [Sulfoacidibacillus ferrooxidans]MCY0892508.1 aspartate aminotransferase family protein [Acidibacillus sp.]
MPELQKMASYTPPSNYTQIREMDREHVMSTYARQPLEIVRGEGVYVFDGEERAYLDFTSGIAVCGLGHCHPALVAAATDQLNQLWHISNIYLTAPQAELAERLTSISGMDRVFFSNSGAEANEAAIKLARRYAKHKFGAHKGDILTFAHSFHGRTIATVTATAQPKYQEGIGPLPGGFRYIEEATMKSVKAAVTEKTAAIMIEPIQGEGGVRPFSSEFLHELREYCTEMGFLLIFDEVQTGAGRTGAWLAWQRMSVKPDIVTMAKSLAGGLPMGATLATEDVAKAFTPGTHGSTFGGNPVAARAALALIDIVTAPGFFDQVRRREQQLYGELVKLAALRSDIVDVRGLGLMWGIQLKTARASEVVDRARDLGLLLLTAGADTVRLLPPLIVTGKEIESAVAIVNKALG